MSGRYIEIEDVRDIMRRCYAKYPNETKEICRLIKKENMRSQNRYPMIALTRLCLPYDRRWTLSSLANFYNTTRERIRQLEYMAYWILTRNPLRSMVNNLLGKTYSIGTIHG